MARRSTTDRFVSEEGVDFVFEPNLNKVAKTIKTILISDFNSILRIQQQELKMNNCYRRAWQEADGIFHGRKNEIDEHYKKYHDSLLPREYHVALIAYTLDGDMYGDFNQKTREFKDLANYHYRSLFTLLYNAIKDMPGHPNETPLQVYRVVKLSKWNPKIGSTGAVCQFDSTTRSAQVALSFYDANTTVFIIRNEIKCGICLDLHSIFRNQDSEFEYLIGPSTCYTVKGRGTTQLAGRKVNSITLETKSLPNT